MKKAGTILMLAMAWTTAAGEEYDVVREFYERFYTEYMKPETWKWQDGKSYANSGQGSRAMDHDDKTMFVFEPSVAERVMNNWLAEMKVEVLRKGRTHSIGTAVVR